jgi:hypothetical protein
VCKDEAEDEFPSVSENLMGSSGVENDIPSETPLMILLSDSAAFIIDFEGIKHFDENARRPSASILFSPLLEPAY